uniref:Uncharacterized protein n=1 Tax=Magallana gigas TaxID=29159 RepID=A0A8W8MDA5_MAGGI
MAGIDVNPDGIQFIVQPYQFEPHRGPKQPLSSSESSSESDSERDSDIDAVATDEWCICNNCVATMYAYCNREKMLPELCSLPAKTR